MKIRHSDEYLDASENSSEFSALSPLTPTLPQRDRAEIHGHGLVSFGAILQKPPPEEWLAGVGVGVRMGLATTSHPLSESFYLQFQILFFLALSCTN